MKRILCATDLSRCSLQALHYALKLALRLEARLDVIHVKKPGKATSNSDHGLQSNDAVKIRLQDEVEAMLNAGNTESIHDPNVFFSIIHSHHIPSAIVDYAKNQETDIIVLGTRGQGGLKRLLLGSIAEEVVRISHCHVLTVQEDSNLPPIQRILVPVDFSDETRDVIHHARELAPIFDSQLELLHILLDPQPPDFYSDNSSLYRTIDVSTDKLAEKKLKKEFVAAGGPDVAVSYHIQDGEPSTEIIEFINQHDCDLVVMSTKGLQGFMRFLLGSISEAVMRKAACPILTVKVPENE